VESICRFVFWVSQYADLRFRTESTSPRDVCVWARFDARLCSEPSAQAGMLDPVLMTTDHDSSATLLSADSNSNVSTTNTSTVTTSPLADSTTRQRRHLRSSSVIGIGNGKSNSTGESVTKELTWSILEHEDVFLANEVRSTTVFIRTSDASLTNSSNYALAAEDHVCRIRLSSRPPSSAADQGRPTVCRITIMLIAVFTCYMMKVHPSIVTTLYV